MDVALLTDRSCVSVANEAEKIRATLSEAGVRVSYEHYDRPRQVSRNYDKYIFFNPLLSCYFVHLFVWNRVVGSERIVVYTVIEGIHDRVRTFVDEVNKVRVVVPSRFVMEMCERQGVHVDGIIPHQVPQRLPIDHEYGRRWRSRFPPGRKVLLYNGSNVKRKGLSKLRAAVDELSRRRSDFIMVFHTDKLGFPFHTPPRELEGANTVVELDFGKVDVSKVYAKMYYSDVIVHPALCEGFGLPVAEALSLGKRLVCIDAPGVNEVASPANSWMVTDVRPHVLEWPYWVKYCCVNYDVNSLVEQIELCLDAGREEVEEKKAKGFEAVSRLQDTYKMFLKHVA